MSHVALVVQGSMRVFVLEVAGVMDLRKGQDYNRIFSLPLT